MMITLIIMIKILSMGWFCTQISSILETVNEATKGWKQAGHIALNKLQCLKCLTFWATLAMTLNFPLACFVGLVATIIDTHLLTENTKL